MKHLAICSCLFVLTLGACDKKDGTGAAGSASGAAAAPAAADACAGDYASKEKVFCIKVAAGYKAEAETKNDPNIDTYFKKDGAPSYKVFYRKDPGYEFDTWNAAMDEKADHIKVEKRETFTDKKGGWVQRTTNNGATHQVMSVVQGKGFILICDVSGGDKPVPAELVEACKSLKAHPG